MSSLPRTEDSEAMKDESLYLFARHRICRDLKRPGSPTPEEKEQRRKKNVEAYWNRRAANYPSDDEDFQEHHDSPLDGIAAPEKEIQYSYKPLSQDGAIRLLLLHPGARSDSITCDLSEVPLEQIPVYEAVSYVWGAPQHRESVIIDGASLSITPNLHEVLTCIRHTSEIRTIWVDAICINQSDLRERASQVGIMKKIYENAQRVIAWVGPDDDQDKMALTLIKHIGTWCCKAHNVHVGALRGSKDLLPLVDWFDPELLPPVDSDLWVALFRFFELPYFCRIWVVQELQVNDIVLAVCGDVEVQFDYIALVARWVSFAPLEIYRQTITDRGFTNVTQIRVLPTTQHSLLGILDKTRGFFASDPKDKIFAFLNSTSAGEVLSVVYENSILDVFLEAAVFMLRENGFQCLSFVHHRGCIPDEFPSWVPIFDEEFVVPLSRFKHLNAGGLKYLPWTVEERVLRIQAFRVDIVSGVESRMTPSGFDLLSERLFQTNLEEIWPIYTTGNNCEPTYPSGETVRAAFSQVLTAGLTIWGEEGDNQAHQKCFDAYDERMIAKLAEAELQRAREIAAANEKVKQSLEDQISLSPPQSARMPPPTEADIVRWNRNDLSEYGNWGLTLHLAKVEKEERAPWLLFKQAAELTCSKRVVFTTANGYLGLGPSAMNGRQLRWARKGYTRLPREETPDEVWIIPGARTPFVLRQKDTHYQLVGECYVHGLMNGEAMKKVESGEYQVKEIDIC